MYMSVCRFSLLQTAEQPVYACRRVYIKQRKATLRVYVIYFAKHCAGVTNNMSLHYNLFPAAKIYRRRLATPFDFCVNNS